MRCPACKQYVPDGLGLKTCPSCNADITVAIEPKIVSAVDKAAPIIPESKLTPPSHDAPKPDSKLDSLATDGVKKKRESLGFVLATCLLYAIACKFIYGSEYFRTLSMAGAKILAYTTFFGEFFVLKIIEIIIYLRALWVVGGCAQRLVEINRSKLPTWVWVCLQLVSPFFFAKFGAAIIPFYFFSQFESLANGSALAQSPYLHKRKSREEVDRDQKRTIIFLISAIVLLVGTLLVVFKFESHRNQKIETVQSVNVQVMHEAPKDVLNEASKVFYVIGGNDPKDHAFDQLVIQTMKSALESNGFKLGTKEQADYIIETNYFIQSSGLVYNANSVNLPSTKYDLRENKVGNYLGQVSLQIYARETYKRLPPVWFIEATAKAHLKGYKTLLPYLITAVVPAIGKQSELVVISIGKDDARNLKGGIIKRQH